jgi:hypothetical protein
VGILIGFLVVAALNNSVALFRLVPLDKPPMVLADRARQILSGIGLDARPAASVFELDLDPGFLSHIEDAESTLNRWDQLRGSGNTSYYFWYRESPWSLVPYELDDARVTYHDPPMITPGMAYVRLDTEGRLRALEVVRAPADGEPTRPDSIDWSGLFAEAGLDPSAFEQVRDDGPNIDHDSRRWQGPGLSPRVPVDQLRAWVGPSPWPNQDSVRVRAGAYHGAPVFFATHFTYEDPTRAESDQEHASTAPGAGPGMRRPDSSEGSGMIDVQGGSNLIDIIGVIIGTAVSILVIAVLFGAPVMAWRHLRQGRGDRHGALRFGIFVFTLLLLKAILAAHHSMIRGPSGAIDLSYEINMIVVQIGTTLFLGTYIGLTYLALEPYVRKHWPDSLISWARLLAGRIQDPLVGRDVLVGGIVGVLISIAWQLRFVIPGWSGWAPPRPFGVNIDALSGGSRAIAAFLSPWFLVFPMFGVLALVLLVIVVRRRWLAVGLLVALLAGLAALVALPTTGGQDVRALVTVLTVSAIVLVSLLLFARFGLLAVCVCFFFFMRLHRFPITLDPSAWYSGTSAVTLLALAAVAIFAFRTSIARRRIPSVDFSPR